MFLAIVVAVSGYATIDRHITNSLGRGLGTLNAQAVVLDGGGYVGDIAFGRYSTIIKPVAIPTSAPSSHTQYIRQMDCRGFWKRDQETGRSTSNPACSS